MDDNGRPRRVPAERERIRSEAQRARERRRVAFREYIAQLLRDRGVSLRAASIAMARDEAYLGQLLDPNRQREVPTPDDLKLLAEWLGDMSLLPQMLEVAWGINLQEVYGQVQALLGKRTEALERAGLGRLSDRELQAFLVAIAHLAGVDAAERDFERNGD